MTFLNRKYGYLIVLEEDDGGWFIAHVPELPGCISQGYGFEDAIQNITGAIDDYLSLLQGELFQPSVTGSPDGLEETSTGATSTWVSAA